MSDTVFTKVDYTLGALIHKIELGEIGLPDIQRPFVWKNSNRAGSHESCPEFEKFRTRIRSKVLRLLPRYPLSRAPSQEPHGILPC